MDDDSNVSLSNNSAVFISAASYEVFWLWTIFLILGQASLIDRICILGLKTIENSRFVTNHCLNLSNEIEI